MASLGESRTGPQRVAKALAIAPILALGTLATAMAAFFLRGNSAVPYLLLALIWAALAGWLAVALVVKAVSPRVRDLPIPRPGILLSASAGSLSLGAVGLSLVVLPCCGELVLAIVLVFLTAGLVLFGIAWIEFPKLTGRVGRIAVILASIGGAIAMGLASFLVYALLFVTGRAD